MSQLQEKKSKARSVGTIALFQFLRADCFLSDLRSLNMLSLSCFLYLLVPQPYTEQFDPGMIRLFTTNNKSSRNSVPLCFVKYEFNKSKSN